MQKLTDGILFDLKSVLTWDMIMFLYRLRELSILIYDAKINYYTDGILFDLKSVLT